MKGVIFYTLPSQLSIWGDTSSWTSSLDKMGFDFYIMIDEQLMVPSWVETKPIEGVRANSMNHALEKLEELHPECETVLLSQTASTDLKDFTEPVNVCYICGPDNGGEPNIETDHKVSLSALNLWAIECISAVWGRFL